MIVERNDKGCFVKGGIPWNKGKKIQSNTGKTHFKLNHIPWNKGIKGIHLSPKSEFKKGNIPWIKGLTKDGNNIIARMAKNKLGKNNPNWQGGITSLTNKRLNSTKWGRIAEKIRERDNYICQDCGEYGDNVHHVIPWNISEDNSPENLITLCSKCHSSAENKLALSR